MECHADSDYSYSHIDKRHMLGKIVTLSVMVVDQIEGISLRILAYPFCLAQVAYQLESIIAICVIFLSPS